MNGLLAVADSFIEAGIRVIGGSMCINGKINGKITCLFFLLIKYFNLILVFDLYIIYQTLHLCDTNISNSYNFIRDLYLLLTSFY
jgi:hypothetical protein